MAQQKLLMVGGGNRTKDVIQKMVDLSGGNTGKLLVITWAGSQPDTSFFYFKKDIEAITNITLVKAPFAPLNPESKDLLIRQLKECTGVFFTGGDQNRIMEVLKDDTIFQLMHQRYNEGMMFSGTSAGTAIMSEIMITGEGNFTVIDPEKVEIKKGLGLVKNAIIDQHFIKRQRQNRLIGLLTKYPKLLGIGIDEDTGFLMLDNKIGEVLGDSQIMIFKSLKKPKEMKFLILEKGEKFDLKKRKKLK